MEQKPQRGVAALLSAAMLLVSVTFTMPRRPEREQAVSTGTWTRTAEPAGGQPTAETAGRCVVPVGRTVGIKLFSDGVLVVGLSDVQGAQTRSPARDMGLKVGDVITHVNGKEVDTIEQVQTAIQTLAGRPMTLKVTRQDKQLQLNGSAACTGQGSYQLGAWIRDSMAGIGTMTFYDPQTGVFGALGHGVNDVDTARLMTMQAGSILYSTVNDVKKGRAGEPGELRGSLDVQRDLGELYANTDAGIFGTVEKPVTDWAQPIPVAARDEVRPGPAVIRSNVAGEEVKEYQVEIVHVYPVQTGELRNMMLKVTDPELLERTGGIVQGMSGSPIIQNGKLVGAVTHVLVNDPERGYGIFIENMLDAAK